MNDYWNKDIIKRTFVFGFRSNPDDDEYPDFSYDSETWYDDE